MTCLPTCSDSLGRVPSGQSLGIAQSDSAVSDPWDDVDADFFVEERLYDEIFRLRRRLWIERAGLLVAALATGSIGAGYF